MAQSKITITGLSNKADADKITENTASVVGVKFVNVNYEQGFAMVGNATVTARSLAAKFSPCVERKWASGSPNWLCIKVLSSVAI